MADAAEPKALHLACQQRGCCLDEANEIIRRLAEVTYNGQANPHILLIEQADEIERLKARIAELEGTPGETF